MADLPSYDSLYRETLEAAMDEAQELKTEIEKLRETLTQLEQRKKAVDNICRSIGRWVETTAAATHPFDEPNVLALEEQSHSVALTEEEVSLIAYPSSGLHKEA